ncbi:MAG: cytochrome P460 family protein [Candidatus Poribacteria bacterium]|nr:cytochrome P460 family protein [Candidatus Poribacteria bacterium]MDE0505309.1 cytochrome P460 family protein [Candidatus Poribacteria bacterium]
MKYQHTYNTISRCVLIFAVLSICIILASCDEKITLDLVEPEPTKDTTDNTTGEMMPVQPIALPGLPADITGYNQWLKLNAEPIPPVAGSDPHRGTKDVYVNQERDVLAPAGRQQYPYPDGSIVVKESRSDAGFIRLVAIMRKKAGSNPGGNDWEYEEYIRRDADSPFPGPLTGAFCQRCHSDARDRDYVFTVLE